jgi:hypothetical protein
MASKRRMTGTLAGASLAVATAMLAGKSADAATLFSTGFETSQGYTTGAYLTGQPSSGTTFGSAVTAGLGANSSGSATVYTYASSGITPTGTNYNYVGLSDLSGIPAGGSAYYFPNLSSFSPAPAATPVIDVIATFGIDPGGSGNAGFGLTAFDGTAAGNEVADVQINSTTGAVTVDNGGVATGFTQLTSPVTFDSYELQLNYATQTYNVYEAASGSATFTNEIATGVPFETAATTFSTAGLDTTALGIGTATGFALADNFSITAVPEPTTASLVLGGLVVAGTRRRRRSSAR